MRVATSSLLVAAFAVHPGLVRADEPATPQAASDPAVDVGAEAPEEPAAAPVDEPAAPAPLDEAAPAPEPTDAPLVCENSTDHRCGPFFWDPEPDPNQPLVAEVTYTPAHPKVGDEVTFDVTLTDPDAPNVIVTFWFGDEKITLIPPLVINRRFGRWTPPPKERGYWHGTFTHVYDSAGTFRASLWGASAFGGTNPYGSETSWFTQLHVEDTATPSPSASPTDASPSPSAGSSEASPSAESSVEPSSSPTPAGNATPA